MQKILRVLFLLLVILTSFATLPIHSASAFTFAAEINKRFDPPEIVAGDISTLIITIYNSNTFALENASFTDSIIGRQAGLRIASSSKCQQRLWWYAGCPCWRNNDHLQWWNCTCQNYSNRNLCHPSGCDIDNSGEPD